MPTFQRIIAELKNRERHLAAQLAGIRTAISSLEFGSAGAPRPAIIETPKAAGRRSKKAARRKTPAAGRKALSRPVKRSAAARRKARMK